METSPMLTPTSASKFSVPCMVLAMVKKAYSRCSSMRISRIPLRKPIICTIICTVTKLPTTRPLRISRRRYGDGKTSVTPAGGNSISGTMILRIYLLSVRTGCGKSRRSLLADGRTSGLEGPGCCCSRSTALVSQGNHAYIDHVRRLEQRLGSGNEALRLAAGGESEAVGTLAHY